MNSNGILMLIAQYIGLMIQSIELIINMKKVNEINNVKTSKLKECILEYVSLVDIFAFKLTSKKDNTDEELEKIVGINKEIIFLLYENRKSRDVGERIERFTKDLIWINKRFKDTNNKSESEKINKIVNENLKQIVDYTVGYMDIEKNMKTIDYDEIRTAMDKAYSKFVKEYNDRLIEKANNMKENFALCNATFKYLMENL